MVSAPLDVSVVVPGGGSISVSLVTPCLLPVRPRRPQAIAHRSRKLQPIVRRSLNRNGLCPPVPCDGQDPATIRQLRVRSPRYFTMDIRGNVLQQARAHAPPLSQLPQRAHTSRSYLLRRRVPFSLHPLLFPQVLELGTLPLKLRLGVLSYAVDPTGEQSNRSAFRLITTGGLRRRLAASDLTTQLSV